MTAGRKTIIANSRESFFWVKVNAAGTAEDGVEGVAVGVAPVAGDTTETEGKPPRVPETIRGMIPETMEEGEGEGEGEGESMPEVMTGPGARELECEGAAGVWMLTEDMREGCLG